MNIAMFSDSYYPYVSGVVRSIELFRQELEKLGHNVYVFAPSYRQQKKEEGVFSLSIHNSPHLKRFFSGSALFAGDRKNDPRPEN